MTESDSIYALVRTALRNIAQSGGRPELQNLPDDADLYEAFDSFGLVDILMETEVLVEAHVGHYVALADETLMDSQKTPFRSLSGWVHHVQQAVARG